MALQQVEKKIKSLILNLGREGKLILDFPCTQTMGPIHKARTVYLEPDAKSIYLLKQISGVLIQAMLDHEVLSEDELSHVIYNQDEGRFENEVLHCTLMNCNFAKQRSLDARDIPPFQLLGVAPTTIEISTRGQYNKDDGFY